VKVFDAAALANRLQTLHGLYGVPKRYMVATSGGMDSVVLLHALSCVPTDIPILALHIDHQLQVKSAEWDAQTDAFAARLGVDYRSVAVAVDVEREGGPEAAARAARYRVFEAELQRGDWLLCAHHQDDQAETLLLNLLRGSGPLGLAAMPACRELGNGLLVRPLLDTPRQALAAYATRCDLTWIDDPSNTDTSFDRNYLRHEIMPRLQQRWPAASAALARSAQLSAEAQALLDALAADDAERLTTSAPHRLSVPQFDKLTPDRQRNALRYVCRQLGVPPPPPGRLAQILNVPDAAEDAQPLIEWQLTELRRYRDELFILTTPPPTPGASGRLSIESPVELGEGLGRLTLEPTKETGISPEVAQNGLIVRYRQGGERLRPTPNGPSQRLKTLLQSAGVLPWMRDRVPLLEASDQLVGVGDLWTDTTFIKTPGYKVVWHNRPQLF